MRFITALITVLVATSATAADLKVGVVDMTKAFTEYYKTKDASSKMKSNKDKAMTEMNERFATYKTLLNDVQKKQKESQDPILTQEGRAKSGAEFQEKLKEARALEQEINEFQQRRSMQLKQEEMQLQKGLYDEIVAVVKDKSKTAGYDLVFDKSGVSMTTVPVLLYYKDATEFTDEVIVDLNKNAPADSGKKDEDKKSDEKPAKKSK
jgi:outer membrane protein